ncbi:hypothetical protein E3G68_005113 [Mycobacteroides abscessus]|uniref:hypothetical protein n=1 Tax=Mycobacteroides abscessus TaxID=36809 RepID=UPI001C6C496B|nr:hypothetical protein [Mycobacteroides abscessus]
MTHSPTAKNRRHSASPGKRARPWKVHFHFEGTKTFSDDEAMTGHYVIDTSRPIEGATSHLDDAAARAAARRVSRNGGTARITLRDSITGDETEIRTYAPYEVALEDLVERESW